MSAKRRRQPAASPAAAGQVEPVAAPAVASTPRALAAVSALSGLLALAAYLATLSPTVAGGDSGELIAVAYSLGIAHPPGYPLYTLLGKLFTLLPVGSIALRVNLLSACCDAGAAALLTWAAARWTGRPAAGLVAAALFAFSPIVWPYAVVAEVFALNNLFAAGLVALSVPALEGPTPRPRVLLLAALWSGLGLSNHHTLVFLAAPLLLLLATRARLWRQPRLALGVAGAFLLGLLPYLYLLLAGRRGPLLAWGDPSTLEGFFRHLLRREYGTFRLATEDVGTVRGGAAPRLVALLARLFQASFGLLPLLGLSALLALRGARRALLAFWLAALAFYVVVFASLSNVRLDVPLHVTVQERFWQQVVVVAAALAAVGFAELLALTRARRRRAEPVLAVVVAALLFGLQVKAMDHRGQTLVRDWGTAILDSLPRDAVLLITSDEAIGSVRYLQQVEGLRPDVRVVPTGQITMAWFRAWAGRHLPGVVLPPGEFSAGQLFDANPTVRFFVVNRVPWLQSLEEHHALWPRGIPEELLPRGATPEPLPWLRDSAASFARFDAARAQAEPEGSWERYIAEGYWKAYQRWGVAAARVAAAHPGDLAVQRAVAEGLEELARRHPAPDSMVFKNLGVAYQILSRQEPALRARMVEHWRRFLAVGPPRDPDRAAIRSLLESAPAP